MLQSRDRVPRRVPLQGTKGEVCDSHIPPERQDGHRRNMLGHPQRELGPDSQRHLRLEHHSPDVAGATRGQSPRGRHRTAAGGGQGWLQSDSTKVDPRLREPVTMLGRDFERVKWRLRKEEEGGGLDRAGQIEHLAAVVGIIGSCVSPRTRFCKLPGGDGDVEDVKG